LILTKIFGSDVLREESLEGDGNGTSIDTDTGTGTDDNVPRTLSKILNGGGSGCNFIHKILSIPSLEVWIKRKILVKIRLALQDVVIENNSMRRLAEECGVRNGNGNGNGTVNGNGSVLRSGHRSSVASVGGWNGVNGGGRSRSNSAATMESPPRGVSAGAGVGAGVDYDLLLRQQLGDLTLNASGMNENGNAVQMNMNMMNNLMLNNMNMGLNMNMLNGNGGGNGSYGS
jgi:protein JSN1